MGINSLDGNDSIESLFAAMANRNHSLALLISCKFYYYEMIKTLIVKGADVNFTIGGQTPLHIVSKHAEECDSNKKLITNELIRNGANIHSKDDYGNTPLHYTVNAEMAEYLIKKGADVNSTNNKGQTPLHMIFTQGDHYFYSYKQFSIYKLFILKGSNVNAKDNNEQTILHYICGDSRHFDESNIKFILNIIKSSSDINARDNEGRTPLHLACNCYYGMQPERIVYLITNGAEVNTKDNYGDTPLHSIISFDGVELELELGDRSDTKGEWICEYNIYREKEVNNIEWYGDYYNYHDDYHDADDEWWDTSQDYGDPEYVNTEYIRYNDDFHNLISFLIKNGADVNSKNNDEEVPLNRAILSWMNCVLCAKTLIDNGADINILDEEGESLTEITSLIKNTGYEKIRSIKDKLDGFSYEKFRRELEPMITQ